MLLSRQYVLLLSVSVVVQRKWQEAVEVERGERQASDEQVSARLQTVENALNRHGHEGECHHDLGSGVLWGNLDC